MKEETLEKILGIASVVAQTAEAEGSRATIEFDGNPYDKNDKIIVRLQSSSGAVADNVIQHCMVNDMFTNLRFGGLEIIPGREDE